MAGEQRDAYGSEPCPEPPGRSPYRYVSLPVWSGNPVRDRSWLWHVACRPADWEIFVVAGPDNVKAAKAMCRRCPVQAACLMYAVWRPQTGIWGGVVPQKRTRLRREWADEEQRWTAEQAEERAAAREEQLAAHRARRSRRAGEAA